MGSHLIENNDGQRHPLLLGLPIDIFIVIVKNLDARELAALSGVCRLLHGLVASTGWETYILSRPRPSISLSQHLDAITPLRKARYIHLVDRAWASRTSVVRPLALNYYAVRDASPYLVATRTMLIIGVANALQVCSFSDGGTDVRWRGSVPLHRGGAHDDITGLGALSQAGRGECVVVSLANGKVLRVRLSPNDEPLHATVTAHYSHPPTHITSLSTSTRESKAGLALTTALGGLVSLYNTRSPWIEPTRLEALKSAPAPGKKHSRIWCSLVAQSDSLAITGSTQLSLYPILPTGLGAHGTTLSGPAKSSACYALAHPPGSSRDLILSGWHDGSVRMYDLRTGAVELTMQDPWSDSAVYSVGAGGGSGAHVVAGYSNHGMIAIFDIRSPTNGYTVYAPFSSLSPPRPRNGLTQVSSLHVEGARIFATTPHLPFVLDFGPDVTQNTYPFVKEKSDRMTPDGRSFYYTMGYNHPSGYPEPIELI
ncbi:F-box protein [Rhizoctonia solani AG-3 Rhs1AP]|uniref:F-box protein n=1 Tax=Rhizoctonia solani AG-3 Rhs1AP TaxID=1086054 RepID=X8JJH1_9AGAM|nr:F-box protein [Rhizoctonia solani AG-3 Rhs1AP]